VAPVVPAAHAVDPAALPPAAALPAAAVGSAVAVAHRA
jgi:hypothetical protein